MFVRNTGTDFETSDSDCSMVSQSDSEAICEIELKDTGGEIYPYIVHRLKMSRV